MESEEAEVNHKGLFFFLLILTFQLATAQTNSLKIGWDANQDSDLLGYRVYWGTESHSYRFYIDAGNETKIEIVGLVDGLRYYIAVTAIDFWGNESPFSREVIAIPGQGAVSAPIPTILRLGNNFPNPFNPETIITFEVPDRQFISINVYNGLGQKIKTLESRVFDANFYETRWDGTDDNNRRVSAGIYFYRIESVKKVMTRTMTFLR